MTDFNLLNREEKEQFIRKNNIKTNADLERVLNR